MTQGLADHTLHFKFISSPAWLIKMKEPIKMFEDINSSGDSIEYCLHSTDASKAALTLENVSFCCPRLVLPQIYIARACSSAHQ